METQRQLAYHIFNRAMTIALANIIRRIDIKTVTVVLLLLIPVLCRAEQPVSREIRMGKGIILKYETSRFDKSNNTITDCGDGYICAINNTPCWGADGGVPATVLNKLALSIKGKVVELDTSGMYNPLIADPANSNFQVENYYGNVWKVRGRFSDGAAAYYAEWLVANGSSTRTMFGDAELLHDAFYFFFQQKQP